MAHWYDKYLKREKKETKKSYHSSFWADEFDFDYESSPVRTALNEVQIDTIKKYRLSSARKAISNFVTIATGQSIPVKFSTGQQSYTDGKTVVISGDVDDSSKFDIAVGLSLHEGSHVLLSDFTLLADLGHPNNFSKERHEAGIKAGISSPLSYLKDVLNVVEDRRIDNYIYKSAPGYREYYLKLYEKYFGDKTITEALKTDWNEETAEHYMNRLINIMNPASDLVTLKGMRRIWNVLDIHNISRLKTTKDALGVALQIYDIICESIPAKPFNKQTQNEGQSQDGDEGEENQQQGGSQSESSEGDNDEGNSQSRGKSPMGGGDDKDSRDGSNMDTAGDGDGEGEGKESDKAGKPGGKGSRLSPNKLKKLEKMLKEQKEFLNGKLKKKKISQQLQKDIESIESAGAEMTHVANNFDSRKGSKGCEVVVLKELTRKMMEDGAISIVRKSWDATTKTQVLRTRLSETDMATAERMGTIMAKKLQVRNEARTTVFNRQRNGKIDRRLVHSLGFDAESVFTQLHIDKYKKANIHLSIDASSSMDGSKWTQTLINTVALAKAVSMIQNLSMQVSIRWSDDSLPIVLIAYDSRKDGYQKVKSLFPYLCPNGTTPEGLCFEAIHKLLVPSSADMDSYFVNISDGEPCFNNRSIEYTGYQALEHTRKEVERIRKSGIGVLSYFVSDRKLNHYEPFSRMYGKDSRYIDINSVGEVSKTLNRMFLTKE